MRFPVARLRRMMTGMANQITAPDRLALVVRKLRTRWVTVPLRLTAGIATVISASVAAQWIGDTFRPRRDQLDSITRLAAYFAAAAFVAITVLGAYALFVRLTERRWPSELQPRAALRELPTGVALGLSLSALSVLLIWVVGAYHVDGLAARSTWAALVVRGLAVAVASSVIEELIVRGLVLRILSEAVGRWWALALSSFLFGVLHMANPNSSITDGLILVVEAGFLLGAAFLWTGRLWLPIGIHGGWNFAVAAIFGGALSGQQVSAIVDARLVGPEWISGGAFGIEGSAISTVTCCIAGLTMLHLTLRHRRHTAAEPYAPTLAKTNGPTDQAPTEGGSAVV